MLIPPAVWDALQQAGISVASVGAHQVRLARAEDRQGGITATVLRRSAPLSPSHVRQATPGVTGDVLLVVASASPAALAAALAAGRSVVALNAGSSTGPTGHLLLPDGVIPIGPDQRDEAPAGPTKRPGRTPWGTFAVLRHLLTGPWTTQADLAAKSSVSQPKVSQTLKRFAQDGLLRRSAPAGPTRPAGWEPVDWDALLAWWLRNYPGPGGITTYWYGLGSPTDQVRTALAALSPSGARLAVSGDVAGDVLAPWRRPVRAVVYAQPAGTDGADLISAGLTPSGEQEATLELIVPADPGVWTPEDSTSQRGGPGEHLPLADLLQVVWDIQRAPGTDSDQAVAALLPTLKARASGEEP